MKSSTCFLCMKKLGMMWVSEQAEQINLIAPLVSLIRITGNIGMS